MYRITAVVTCGCVRAADHAVCYASDVAQVYTREKYHLSFPTHADAKSKLAGHFQDSCPAPKVFLHETSSRHIPSGVLLHATTNGHGCLLLSLAGTGTSQPKGRLVV